MPRARQREKQEGDRAEHQPPLPRRTREEDPGKISQQRIEAQKDQEFVDLMAFPSVFTGAFARKATNSKWTRWTKTIRIASFYVIYSWRTRIVTDLFCFPCSFGPDWCFRFDCRGQMSSLPSLIHWMERWDCCADLQPVIRLLSIPDSNPATRSSAIKLTAEQE